LLYAEATPSGNQVLLALEASGLIETLVARLTPLTLSVVPGTGAIEATAGKQGNVCMTKLGADPVKLKLSAVKASTTMKLEFAPSGIDEFPEPMNGRLRHITYSESDPVGTGPAPIRFELKLRARERMIEALERGEDMRLRVVTFLLLAPFFEPLRFFDFVVVEVDAFGIKDEIVCLILVDHKPW
jgi:hypothetical protein